MKSPKEIGEILKETRQKKSLTVEASYKATRIQPSVIESLERGNADGILSRIYVLSFVKKYAFFLDLDGDALAAEYKKFYTDKEKQVLTLNEEPRPMSVETQKWMIFAVFAGLALLFVFFILALGMRLRSTKSAPVARASAPPVAPKTVPLFPIPEKKPIKLTLESTDEVWMKVKKDGKDAFVGILRKNRKENWSAKNKIELWVGRAEALKFTINGRPVGKIGKGSIKNIIISRRGLKVGNKWLFGAE